MNKQVKPERRLKIMDGSGIYLNLHVSRLEFINTVIRTKVITIIKIIFLYKANSILQIIC